MTIVLDTKQDLGKVTRTLAAHAGEWTWTTEHGEGGTIIFHVDTGA